MTATQRASAPVVPPPEEGQGCLHFRGEPVFATEGWRDGDEIVIHVLDLDIAASGRSNQEAADRAGGMILDLLEHLLEEASADTATPAETERLHLLLERLGPVMLRERRRRPRERRGEVLIDLFREVARMIGGRPTHDWVFGRPSRHDGSEQVSHA
jgi:hypothetical protein